MRIEILDARGTLVRRWSSGDRLTPPNPKKFAYLPLYITKSTRPSASAGLNQFVWDLRYAPVPGLASKPSETVTGPWAPPGRYTVRMQVNGRIMNRPLDVVRDPRIRATDADLQAQFALAWKAELWRARGLAAYHRAQSAIAQLKSRPGAACSAAEVAASIVRLEDIAGQAPPTSPDNSMGYPELNLRSLHALDGQLATLEGQIESADAAPTSDTRHAFDVVTNLLAREISLLPSSVCGTKLM